MSDFYVGLWPTCDCIAAVVVNDHPKTSAQYVAQYVKRGLRVSLMPEAEFRARTFRCEKHPKGTPMPWDKANADTVDLGLIA